MDDGAGLLVCWHAVRLIHTLGLRPRRTVSDAPLNDVDDITVDWSIFKFQRL